jgi:hypothetical protein
VSARSLKIDRSKVIDNCDNFNRKRRRDPSSMWKNFGPVCVPDDEINSANFGVDSLNSFCLVRVRK